MSKTVVEEKKSLLSASCDSVKGSGLANNYGALGCGSPRICLVFSDCFLGGKRASWLAKLKAAGFEVEQSSPRYVAISAPEDMLHRIALAKGSHGEHTMPATKEKALHLLLTQFDDSLGAFLSPPGPFSGKISKGHISDELHEAGLENWFWLHNSEAATSLSPWNTYFGLSRKPLGAIRDYFGTQIAWSLLLTNFYARWMFVPAIASTAYTYFSFISFLRTGSFDTPWLPLVSLFTVLWSALACFAWFRLRRRYEARWVEDVSISGREDLNTDAEYEERVDPDLGEVEFYYPVWQRRVKQATSLLLLALPMLAVVGAGLGCLELRAHLALWHPPLGAAASGAATAVAMIVVVSGVCAHWSAVMTHWENYPRRSCFFDALAAKRFVFDLVAQLFPILYLALLDWPLLTAARPAQEPRIVDALTLQATFAFVTLCAYLTAAHALRGFFHRKQAARIAAAADADAGLEERPRAPDFSHAEQAFRPGYPGPLEEDAWTGVLLVYAVILAPVCPPAPLIAFLWIVSRAMSQVHQLLYVYKRPHPHGGPPGARSGFWAEWMPPAVLLAAVIVHIPLVLFCTTGLSVWLPWLTLEERWAALLSLEAAAVAVAALVWSNTRPADSDALGSA